MAIVVYQVSPATSTPRLLHLLRLRLLLVLEVTLRTVDLGWTLSHHRLTSLVFEPLKKSKIGGLEVC